MTMAINAWGSEVKDATKVADGTFAPVTCEANAVGNFPIRVNGIVIAEVKPFATGGPVIDLLAVTSSSEQTKTGIAFDNSYVKVSENGQGLNY